MSTLLGDFEVSEFQVLGKSGYTRPCLIALDMVLSGPLDPQRATVITTNGSEHLLVLWDCGESPFEGIIIPTGFASGYSGEGASGFSLALCMLHEQDIPIDYLDTYSKEFELIDAGHFPAEWQYQVRTRARKLEMPVNGWVFPQHWGLLQKGRLWRVQRWRRINIDLPDTFWGAIENVDNFSWAVGDKLWHATVNLKRNSPAEKYQQAGIMLRDAWIEFGREVRTSNIPKHIGKDDVRAILSGINLEETTRTRATQAYGSTNTLQHDRNATWEAAKTCFQSTVLAMSDIVGKGNRYPRDDDNYDEWIRPN